MCIRDSRYYAGSGKYQANADQYIYNDTVNVWQYCDNIVIAVSYTHLDVYKRQAYQVDWVCLT